MGVIILVMASKIVKELQDLINKYGDAPLGIELGEGGWDAGDIQESIVTKHCVMHGYIDTNQAAYTIHPSRKHMFCEEE